MKIKDLPEFSKPLERFIENGPNSLSDAELLALILKTGTQGENVIEMSNRLISEYGLEKLFQWSTDELQKIKGIGKSKAVQILSVEESRKRISMNEKKLRKRRNLRIKILRILKQHNKLTYTQLQRTLSTNYDSVKENCEELEYYGLIKVEKKEGHPRNNHVFFEVSLTEAGQRAEEKVKDKE